MEIYITHALFAIITKMVIIYNERIRPIIPHNYNIHCIFIHRKIVSDSIAGGVCSLGGYATPVELSEPLCARALAECGELGRSM